MSEYQYYEFQAIDRPLGEQEIRALRASSSRATITPTRFVNHYEWGNFKGDTSKWMEKYFDAFLYVANWGTREFILRLPRNALRRDTVRRYLGGEMASARWRDAFVLLAFSSESESGDDWDDDGSGWLSSLTPIRADLVSGDLRSLYLAWLHRVQAGEIEDDVTEPPVPRGLGQLTASLQAFADFLRLDRDLVEEAAERSPRKDAEPSPDEIERLVQALPGRQKTALLVRLVTESQVQLRHDLMGRLQRYGLRRGSEAIGLRSAGHLLESAGRRSDERHRGSGSKPRSRGGSVSMRHPRRVNATSTSCRSESYLRGSRSQT